MPKLETTQEAIPDTVTHEAEDLSSEWDNSLSVEAPAAHEAAEQPAAALDPNNPEIPETVEEVRFYLEHYMAEQARAAFSKLETLTRDASILNPLRTQIENCGTEPAVVEAEPEIADNFVEPSNEFAVDETPAPAANKAAHPEPEEEDIPAVAPKAASKVRKEAPKEKQPEPAHAAAEGDELAHLVADLESSLGDVFPEPAPAQEQLPAWPKAKPEKAAPPKSAPEPTPAVAKKAVRKLEPEFEPAAAHASIPAPPVAPTPAIAASASGAAAAPALSYGPTAVRPLGAGAQAMMPQAGVDLSEMFGELKQELEEEAAAGDDDPETHYNLGVAFREMGLLDEAIAELQKVCNAVDRGHPFSQLVQCYTWLAQCFLDKGVPDAAIRWYEKALTIPGLDAESRIAIHYELGSASESAQNKDAALKYSTQVYGANIDYRDVADRIQALKS